MSYPPPNQPEPEREAALLLAEALAEHEQGRLERAEFLYEAALSLEPRNFVATHQLGVIENQRGNFEAALQFLEKALVLNPKSSIGRMNLGIALANIGRPDEALSQYQLSLVLNPGNGEALLNRAMALRSLKRSEEALQSLDRALAINPEDPKALLNRASLLQELHRPAEALDSFDRALALRPQDASALTCRGVVLQNLNRPAEALRSHDRALAVEPDSADALLNRGVALMDLDRPTEALASIDRSLALHPGQADTLMNRGNALVQLRRHREALLEFDRALAIQPDNIHALMNRGLTLHLSGRHEDAIADFDRVLEMEPHLAKARSAKIFMLDYLPDLTFQRHQEERRQFFQFQARDLPPYAPHLNDRSPDRRLVLGYLSADFKQHSAAASFWPVLRHHDQSEFQIICYSGVLAEDALSRKFQAHASGWVRAHALRDEQLAQRIRQDQVDILVDLSGHSTGNRAMVLALKPAPIQVTAWGHSGGSGLPMVDYQFTDPVHIPPQMRSLFAEASYDLPCCITFEPPDYAPGVSELPAALKGHVTFGSLNRFSKITPRVLDTWSRILASTPKSRLFLKDGLFDDPQLQNEVYGQFLRRGITRERLELRGHTSHERHLSAYSEVDIALDTFPQNGGITTWEALWMGVPLVALVGQHPACRISASILTALGLGGWVAKDEEDYVTLAVHRAQNLSALARFRHDARSLVGASAAGNPKRYTRAVEVAYRNMWHHWLEQGPPPVGGAAP